MASPRSAPEGRGSRFAGRIRRHLIIAAIAGPVAGAALGAIVGAIAFDVGGTGFWMTVAGMTVAGAILALLWAGYGSLESPDPGKEPSDTARPIADRPQPTREEHEE